MEENITEYLFDERYPVGLGCGNCRDLSICGGLSTSGLISCWELCCEDPKTCDYICPRNVEDFVRYTNQIKGFEFENIPRCSPTNLSELPYYVPLILSNSANRREKIRSDSVAIPLEFLVDLESGEAKFNSKSALAEHFGFEEDASLIISGVMVDEPLERYWHISRSEIIESIRQLNPTLVTSPNFSSFVNCPRWDNLSNLKRLAICWQEFISKSIPTAIHMNARTLYDWERWLVFINSRPEVEAISFEFATVIPERKSWYLERLIELAKGCNRKLALVLRGGTALIPQLVPFFPNLTFICTDAYMKAVHRQMVCVDNESFAVGRESDYFIDTLLNGNISARRVVIREKIAQGRSK